MSVWDNYTYAPLLDQQQAGIWDSCNSWEIAGAAPFPAELIKLCAWCVCWGPPTCLKDTGKLRGPSESPLKLMQEKKLNVCCLANISAISAFFLNNCLGFHNSRYKWDYWVRHVARFSFNHDLLQSNPLSVSLWRLIFSTENMDLNVLTHEQLLRGNVILYASSSLETACL